MHTVRRATRLLAVLGLLAPMLVTGRASAADRYLTYWGDYSSNSLVAQTMTPEGWDNYTITKTTANKVGTVTMSANPGNVGGNLRKIFWGAGAGDYLDAESCATWVEVSSESVQEGLALRVVTSPTSTRALTVTKGVWGGINWVFNVHTWDTTRPQPYEQVAQFDMLNAVWQNGGLKSKPWRVCARVTGETLQFKIWFPFQGQAEPSWNDPVYSRSAPVPAAWSQPGKAGWYIGHLHSGETAKYNGLTTYMYR